MTDTIPPPVVMPPPEPPLLPKSVDLFGVTLRSVPVDVVRFKLVVVAAEVVFSLVVFELFTKLLPKEILWTCWFVEGVKPNASKVSKNKNV